MKSVRRRCSLRFRGQILAHETVGVCAEPAGYLLFSECKLQIGEPDHRLGTTLSGNRWERCAKPARHSIFLKTDLQIVEPGRCLGSTILKHGHYTQRKLSRTVRKALRNLSGAMIAGVGWRAVALSGKACVVVAHVNIVAAPTAHWGTAKVTVPSVCIQQKSADAGVGPRVIAADMALQRSRRASVSSDRTISLRMIVSTRPLQARGRARNACEGKTDREQGTSA